MIYYIMQKCVILFVVVGTMVFSGCTTQESDTKSTLKVYFDERFIKKEPVVYDLTNDFIEVPSFAPKNQPPYISQEDLDKIPR